MGCCGTSNLPEEIPLDNSGTIPDKVLLSSRLFIEIENKDKIISGFLFKIPKQELEDFLYFFITPKENITKDMIEKKEDIKLYYENKKKFITITLNSEERIIQDLSDIGMNLIVIELLPNNDEENIVFDYFFSIMKQHKEFEDLKNEEIYLINFNKGEIRYSKGKIEKIENNEFTYSNKSKFNTPGNPIFFSNSTEVIGIQISKNRAYFLGPIYYYFRKYKKTEIEEENTEMKKRKDIEEEKDGKEQGKGTLYGFGGRIIYEGDLKNGKKHGKGKLYHSNGKIEYEGDFVNDEYEGKGKKYRYEGDLLYEGEWEQGEEHGKGKSYSEGKIVYEGYFFKGLYEGKGKYFDTEGNLIYYGEFEECYISGYGKIYEKGKIMYKGEIKDQHCYIGKKKDGKKYGKGIEYDLREYTKYEGEFVDDLYEGKGTIFRIYNNTFSYKGEFKNGRFHGKGTSYNSNGTLSYEGDFVNGR